MKHFLLFEFIWDKLRNHFGHLKFLGVNCRESHKKVNPGFESRTYLCFSQQNRKGRAWLFRVFLIHPSLPFLFLTFFSSFFPHFFISFSFCWADFSLDFWVEDPFGHSRVKLNLTPHCFLLYSPLLTLFNRTPSIGARGVHQRLLLAGDRVYSVGGAMEWGNEMVFGFRSGGAMVWALWSLPLLFRPAKSRRGSAKWRDSPVLWADDWLDPVGALSNQ